MSAHEKPADELLRNLRDETYDLTSGIAAAEHAHVSVRRFEHAGHDIEIHTQYRVVIDGREFPESISVANDGSVHYHGLPQYSTASAVDLVKLIADRLVEGQPPPLIGRTEPDQHHHGDHHHGAGC